MESNILPAAGADIIFVSSDGVQFGLHSKHLEVGSGAFPPVVLESNGVGLTATEPVHLTEPCRVLELLLTFLYPEKWPRYIEWYDLEEYLDIAEAAEKYEVHSAKYYCHQKLKELLKLDLRFGDVMKLAARHGKLDLLNYAAPRMAMRFSLTESVTLLSVDPKLVQSWIVYYELWLDIYRRIPGLIVSCNGPKNPGFFCTITPCSTWSDCRRNILSKYSKLGLRVLEDLDSLFSPKIPDPEEPSSSVGSAKGWIEVPECCERTLRHIKRTVVGNTCTLPIRPFGRVVERGPAPKGRVLRQVDTERLF